MPHYFNALKIFRKALQQQSKLPEHLKTRKNQVNSAYLFVGKASLWQFRQIFDEKTDRPENVMIVSPEKPPAHPNGITFVQAEHPVPGRGSFAASRVLCEWLAQLRENRIRELRIFLSGGGSSLLWLEPAHLDQAAVLHQTTKLYQQSLNIEQLNRRRSQLCSLKGGKAAKLIQVLCPGIKTQVFVVSDVAPFGVHVVSSGPFTALPHQLIASNAILLGDLKTECRQAGFKVQNWEFQNGDVRRIAKAVVKWVNAARAESILVFGAEPKVSLTTSHPGRGGRMSHLAGLILAGGLKHTIELLCASTDGSDGASRSAGVYWRGLAPGAADLKKLKKSLGQLDSASWFARRGALIPTSSSVTNLQDLVLVRLSK